MPGKIHPFEPQPGAAPDFEVDDGEADRDAEPAIEHFVEEAVARVVVMIAVAAEPELLVKVGVERREPDRGRRAFVALEPSGGRFPHALEAQQIRGGVERGILDSGNGQRRRRQGFPRLVQRAQQVVGDTGETRQQGQRHGPIVARTHR